MSDCDPITFRPRPAVDAHIRGAAATSSPTVSQGQSLASQVSFNKLELNEILSVYGRKVAAGEWRDYAMDFGREAAVFSVYRHTSEYPLYRIVKNPKLARRQGAFSVVASGGLILKRGTDLKNVLSVLEKSVRVVD